MPDPMTPEQMRALEADAFAALQEAIENGGRLRMSIPALPGRDTDLRIAAAFAALRAAADQLEAVHEALARHPKCDKYDEDDVVSCGWKSAVRDITRALNPADPAPQEEPR